MPDSPYSVLRLSERALREAEESAQRRLSKKKPQPLCGATLDAERQRKAEGEREAHHRHVAYLVPHPHHGRLHPVSVGVKT